jgi:hypothetical protein
MAGFREQLSDPDLVRFYDYWATLRGARAMPSRRDIDPLQIPAGYLPDLMLIEVSHAPRSYRYRLIGTHVVTASGEDRTGRSFDDVSFFKTNPAVMQQFERVVNTAEPLFSLEPFTNFVTGRSYDVDRIMLPLSSDGRLVDTVLVLFLFKSGPFARRLGTPQSLRTPARALPAA